MIEMASKPSAAFEERLYDIYRSSACPMSRAAIAESCDSCEPAWPDAVAASGWLGKCGEARALERLELGAWHGHGMVPVCQWAHGPGHGN